MSAASSFGTDLALYRRLLRQARPQWLHIVGIFFLDLMATPLGLLSPLPLKIAVDNVVGAQPLPHALERWLPLAAVQSRAGALVLAVALLVGIALLTQIQNLAATLLRTYTGEKLALEFRARLFSHTQRLSISYHDMRGPADSTYRIQYDAAAIQYVPIDGFIPFITAGFTLVAMLYITIRMDWKLALVALTISPLLYVTSQTCRRRLRAQSREVKNLESSAMAVVQEVLSALRVVKSFGREDHEQNRYLRHSNEGLRARIHMGFVGGIFDLLVGVITAVGTATVLWVGVRHVQTGVLTLGELLLLMSYLGRLYEPLRTIGKKSASLQGYLASAERAFSILGQAPDVAEWPNAQALSRAAGEVVFRDISFGYQKGHLVLHNISFEVAAGSRVGIAGRTGAGKTTLMSLLTRFYDPDSGQILLDGMDLREYKVADLRNQFAIVLQEPVLFSTSLAENIAYARPAASEEEIIKAARLANAHDFITRLPEGYQTRVGERGMRLSGGERQRISLARAFLKDAPVLVLDEPTSSVDSRTESAIMNAMERLMKGRTTFIIAHRLSTIENCDLRLEIENGRLISTLHLSAVAGKALTALGGKANA
jgi:ATP-binding cassette, subfamily B, bacterial